MILPQSAVNLDEVFLGFVKPLTVQLDALVTKLLRIDELSF